MQLHPLLVIALFVTCVALIVRPFGNYPVNDDWQYARVAKHLAESGRFEVDVAIAPALVGQAYLAAALIKVFGFSHTLLRALTTVLATLLLWVIDSILRSVGCRRIDRVLCCVLILLNPIFLHLTFSFMTEIYGYLLAFSAVWLWFSGRKRAGDSFGSPIAPLGVCIGAAVLVGLSFWIRQFCVAVLPALFGSALLRRVGRRDWRGIWRSVPHVLLSALGFVGVVYAYFAWAKSSGNYRPEFSGRLDEFLQVNSRLWTLSAFEVLIYLTAFAFPFLVTTPFRKWSPLLTVVGGLLTLAVLILGSSMQRQFAGFHHHLEFPYSANIVNTSRVGPFTLSEEYMNWKSLPAWSGGVTRTLEWLLLASSFAWSVYFAIARRKDAIARELRYFGLLFGGLAFVLFVQAYQGAVLDRYYFPVILAVPLLLAASHLDARPSFSGAPHRRRDVLALVCALPLAWYTLAGVHDYFRWNDARWSLVERALADVEPDNLDGGFEVNGWLNLDYQKRGATPKHCAGACRCNVGMFNCTDDTYQISLAHPAWRDLVATRDPSYWLFPRAPLYLTRRRQ